MAETRDSLCPKPHFALGRRQDEAEHAEKSRLTAARRTNDDDHLSTANRELGGVEHTHREFTFSVDFSETAPLEEHRTADC
jgi:hypothetical protein